MKSVAVLILALLPAVICLAQSPAPDPDTLQNPVKHIDPEVKQLPPDLHYIEDWERIDADELPSAALAALRKLEPDGWEKSVVYRYKKHNTYRVEMRQDGNNRVYLFDRNGKRLAHPENGD